ncbi:hypothetical protein [Actinophytocola sp.]|uniref:hypothetical protein n=1 Tax=Actinophytocola sp. TaxID=1872138 RepID=UPI002ED2FA49
MVVDVRAARRRWLSTVTWTALAAVPVVLMVVEVLRSPRLHFLDYWQILTHATTRTGGLDVGGLFKLHNGHPIVTPGLVFWADATITDGSNNVVGLVNVLLAAAAVVALRAMLPGDLDGTKKGALTVAFAFLVFSSGALEMFGISMSGASWLLGLVPAMFAMLCAHRGHTVAALLLGVLANLGHGTAFALWPALALVAWLRGDALWRVLAPLGAVVALAVGWSLLPAPPGGVGPGGEFGIDTRLAAIAGVLSPIRVEDGAPLSLAVGGAIAVVLAGFVVLAVRERLAKLPVAAVGWVGLGTHMLGAAAMIGLSREDYGPTIGLTARYATLSGLAACAVLALVVLRRPALPPVRVAVATCAVALATFAAGSMESVNVRNQYLNQRLVAVAMRVGADDVARQYRLKPRVWEVAERAGFYPFVDDLDLGCGMRLGSRVPSLKRGVGSVDTGPVRGGVELRGWALVDGRRAECVFVVNTSGVVVGGGYTGLPRPDLPKEKNTNELRAGWAAVAGPSLADNSVVVVSSGGEFYGL